MKAKIHPKYHEAEARCACGASFKIGSAKEKLEVEICSNCHPFYTGGSKLVDTAGRVERFRKRAAKKKSKNRPEKYSSQRNPATVAGEGL